MKHLKILAISAFAVLSLGAGTAVYAEEEVEDCRPNCEQPTDPAGGNPGNGKPVGNSPWDGITGNSGNNNPGPRAAPMDGQRSDNPFAQPGGKGNGPSNANKD